MSGTYSQIYIQVVMAVQNRKALIDAAWEERLYQYITGIIRQKGQKLIAINGMPDHVHVFIGLKPQCCLSDLMREVKKSSNAFINENKLSGFKFSWQEGYGAFSYSHTHIDKVVKYILNQKQHHKRQSFKDEYCEFLRDFSVAYEDKYLFDWIAEEQIVTYGEQMPEASNLSRRN